MLQFDFATCATQGARDYQEDTAATLAFPASSNGASGTPAAGGGGTSVSPANGTMSQADDRLGLVAVLADGMGGHVGGALASQTVCERFMGLMTSAQQNLRDDDLRHTLHEAVIAANDALAEKVAADPVLSGMGSTVIAVSFSSGGGVNWVSVGDSPLLFYRRGEIALLNEDHSLAPELDRMAEAGLITEQQALGDPRRHMLRSALTGDDLELVDRSQTSLQLEPGDFVVLASDGLQTLEGGEIERIIAAYGKDGADAVARALIRAVEAVRAPHQDNATVVVVTPRACDGTDPVVVDAKADEPTTVAASDRP